ncbi:MAG: TonB-dependent receptor plug domain-containing protein [Ginsengibacter sp.]
MRTAIFPFLILFLAPCVLKAQNDSIKNVSKLLDLSLEELMNIKVVTASGYLQTTSEAPSTITVITAQQIADRGYEQLEGALRDIPGIDMIHINGYAPTLIYFSGMYGAENLRALLMIDGIVENNILGTNDIAGPAYSLHNAERIEIVWGPVSALYGANAFGGVINIISKKGADIDGLQAEQGFGSFNTSFEKLRMGLKKSKFEFAVAATLYSTDGPKFGNRDPDYSGSYVDRAYSFNGSVSYYARNSKTTLGYRTYKTPMGWGTYSNSPTTYLGLPPQGYNNQGIVGVIQRDIRGEKSGLDDSYLRTWFIQNEYKPNNKLNFLGRIVYRETGTAEDSYIYVTTDGRRLIRLPIASYSNRISGELSANYSLSENHKFSAGIDYYRDNVEAGARQSTLDLTTIYLIDGGILLQISMQLFCQEHMI